MVADTTEDEIQLKEEQEEEEDSLDVSDMPEHWRNQEDVVITGVSGRFPEADNMAQLEHNLMNGIDMITEDERRRPFGFAGLPRRHGKLRDLTKFDAHAFGVTPKQASGMDPALRLLMEVAYEAIADAGINPSSLRGSRIGVFTGVTISESLMVPQETSEIDGYGLLGCDTTMYANRLSYYFGFVGPSFPVNTACSSSLLALHIALQNIRDGQCDAALVCGAHLNLLTTAALHIHQLNMSGNDGACRSFDAAGTGYCRSEAVAAVFLQRKSGARRLYATVVHTKTNSDGYKPEGITFPSGEQQYALLRDFYSECKINPNDVSLIEAHGTGTPVGDPKEGNSICKMFCRKGRNTPLLVGSVKSNMGHSEPASGLLQIAKVIIAMERLCIPPNLHFNTPNPNIPGLLDGRLKVIVEKTKWKGGYVGINSFGFGGSNVHCLLKSSDETISDGLIEEKIKEEKPNDFPRLVCHAGRTAEGVKEVFQFLEENPAETSVLALLGEISRTAPNFMSHRGYAILNKGAVPIQSVEKMIEQPNDKRPVWYIYSGMGSQWNGMGKQLMQIPTFRESIEKCAASLRPLGMDLVHLLTDITVEVSDNTLHSFVTVAAIQIALTDVLSKMGIKPDGIIGHSFGEVACGYADDCLTAQQAILVAYWRGQCIMQGNLQPGAMAAVGLTWEAAVSMCPADIYPACHNANNSVTVSGPPDSIDAFVQKLQLEDIFAKKVNCTGVAFHSCYMLPVVDSLKSKMQTVIRINKPRSSRWISTSVSNEDASDDAKGFGSASPEYYVNNLIMPVIFCDAVSTIPGDAIVIELAPHALLQTVIKKTIKSSSTSVALMNARKEDQIIELLTALGTLYCKGLSFTPHKLYEPVSYPVNRNTPMIGPLIKWDHSATWPVTQFNEEKSSAARFVINPYDIENLEYRYILDHVIDGRVLFPMAGFLELAWKTLAKQNNKEFEQLPVVLEDIRLLRATNLKSEVTFDVHMSVGNPEFRIMEGSELIMSGNIYMLEDRPMVYASSQQNTENIAECRDIKLNREDVYKQIRIRGYEYGDTFKGIISSCNCGHETELEWTGKWTSFIDSMTQTSLLRGRESKHLLPTRLRYLRIDPVKHLSQLIADSATDRKHLKCYSDFDSSGIHCGGIELQHLVVNSVPRRLPPNNLVSVEKKYFIPYFDERCFQEFPAAGKLLQSYSRAVSNYSKLAFAQCVKKHSVINEPQLTPPHSPSRMQAGRRSTSSDLSRMISENDSYIIGDILMRLVAANSETAKKSIATSMLQKLNEDPLWTCMWQPRALKPMTDLVTQNTILKTETFIQPRNLDPWSGIKSHRAVAQVLKVAQIEAQDTGFLAHCSEMIGTIPEIVSVNMFINKENSGTHLESKSHKLKSECLELDMEDIERNVPDSLLNSQDLVIMEKYLHRTRHPKKILGKIKTILTDEGFVLVSEVIQNFDTLDIIYSLMEILYDKPPGNSMNVETGESCNRNFTHTEWCTLFDDAGYDLISYQKDETVCWAVNYLIRPKREEAKNHLIDVDDIDGFTWINKIQRTVEDISNAPKNEKIWFISKNYLNGLNGFTACMKDESTKPLRFRMIQDVGHSEKRMSKKEIDNRLKADMVMNSYKDGVWGVFLLIPVPKSEQTSYKKTEYAFLHTLHAGNLSSVTWIESSLKYWEPLPKRFDDEVLISVYYGALNFRDVMLASGRIPPDAIQGKTLLDRDYMIGCEYSGRILETGERITGVTTAQSLATVMSGRKSCMLRIPDSWSLEEAATVPMAYMTAYYSLITRGGLQPEESVLIHAGSGGVGQAAIRIAASLGCEVFTTVGSVSKKKFLLETFPSLKESCIGDSRSTSFENMVQKQTNARGVDVVLNSLAEDKLQASVRCLAVNGRFLEIGKYDLQKDNLMGLGIFLKNVSFCGIVLEHVYDDKKKIAQTIQLVYDGMANGVVQPLHRDIFDSDKCEDAFRFMSKGKHTGKVLIKIREEETVKSIIPHSITVSASTRTFYNPDFVFIITGGLGGFGLELADWLVGRGAQKLVLTSRSGVTTGYQARLIDSWKKKHVIVKIMKYDIAKQEQANKLIADCMNSGEIGGIFHLAMVLRDALFENQTVENFIETSQQKLWATKNLDKATRTLCTKNLKWFIAFSSVASGKGHKGQSCYGWANSAMENIIEKRRQDGFCGQVIEWGAIGDVGVVMEALGDNTTVVGGTLPQRMFSCLEYMNVFTNMDHTTVSCYVRNPIEISKKEGSAGSGELLDRIGKIFGVASIKELDPDARFDDLGLDSLMGVEIREAIEKDLDIGLTVKEIQTLTINKLRAIIQGDVQGQTMSDSVGKKDEDNIMNIYRLRCSANELSPTESLVKLNDSTTQLPIFCVHSIEGVAANVKYLAAELQVPFYCFQCTQEVPAISIESTASYYIQQMKQVQPIGPYRLAGYSFGVTVAVEMAFQLEVAGEIVESVIALDSSQLYPEYYRTRMQASYNNIANFSSTPLYESELLTGFSLRFCSLDALALGKELLMLRNFEARLDKVVEIVMQKSVEKFDNPETVRFAAQTLKDKFSAGEKYDFSKHDRKLACDVYLVRAAEGIMNVTVVGDNYGLEQATKGLVTVSVVKGNHDTFIHETSGKEVAILIQKYYSSRV